MRVAFGKLDTPTPGGKEADVVYGVDVLLGKSGSLCGSGICGGRQIAEALNQAVLEGSLEGSGRRDVHWSSSEVPLGLVGVRLSDFSDCAEKPPSQEEFIVLEIHSRNRSQTSKAAPGARDPAPA